MNILLLAPQPFYSERGTPIAVYNLAKVLGEAGHQIDLMTFPGGQDVALDNTHILRVGQWVPFLGTVPVGFSIKKLLLDGVMLFAALRQCTMVHEQGTPYDVIHAVEESVFIALLCAHRARKRGAPLKVIYDMDSSMSDQLIERRAWLSPLRRVLDGFEGFAIRHADQVLAVCQALADKAKKSGSTHAKAKNKVTPITVIEDISSNAISDEALEPIDNIRQYLPQCTTKLLYVGNLETYQGVGLVVEAMAEPEVPDEVGFLVIGGNEADLATHQVLAKQLGVSDRVAFLGPRPVKHLAQYLAQADVLVSPRSQGVNTPMKIYTYLGAAKPIIATDIFSHTQVLDASNACLVSPSREGIAKGICRVADDAVYAQALAVKAGADAERKYSFTRFRERLLALYDTLTNASLDR